MAANQFNQSFTKGRGKNGNNGGCGNGRSGNQFSGGGQFHHNQFFGNGQFHNTNNPVLDPQFFPQNKSSFSQGQKVACQICGKNGHSTLDFYHRMNFAYQGRHALAKLDSIAASSMVATLGANQN